MKKIKYMMALMICLSTCFGFGTVERVARAETAAYDVEEISSCNRIRQVQIGESVTLRVSERDNKNATYLWTKEERNINGCMTGKRISLKQGTEAFCEIPVQNLSDITTYYCEVTDGSKKELVTFLMDEPHAFLVEAVGKNRFQVKKGDDVELKVRVQSLTKEDPFSYYWIKKENASETTEDNKLKTATGSSLTLENLQAKDFGNYACIVTNNSTKQTEQVNFSVTEYTGLFFSSFPSNTIYCTEGNSVRFGVNVENEENIPLYYHWSFFSSGNVNDSSVVENEKAEAIAIYPMKKERYGTYHLSVTKESENGSVVYENTYYVVPWEDTGSNLSLYPAGNGQTEYKRKLGEAVSFRVKASSENKDITYQWYAVAEDGSLQSLYEETKSTLTLKNITWLDYGTYRCIAKSGSESKSILFTLHRTTGLALDLNSYQNGTDGIYEKKLSVEEGRMCVLTAPATETGEKTDGDGLGDWEDAISYQWYKGNRLLYGETSSCYVIEKMRPIDLANYSCVVSDGVDTCTVYYTIRWKDQTKFLIVQNKDSKFTGLARADEKKTIAVQARDLKGRKVHYEWYHNSALVGKQDASSCKTKSLFSGISVYSQEECQNYMDTYYCRVSAGEETAYVYFNFTMASPLKVTVSKKVSGKEMQVKNVQAGEKITLGADMAQSGDWSYEWYQKDNDGNYKKLATTKKNYALTVMGDGTVNMQKQTYRVVASSGIDETKASFTKDITITVYRKPYLVNKNFTAKVRGGDKAYRFTAKKGKKLVLLFKKGSDLRKSNASVTILLEDGSTLVYRKKNLSGKKITIRGKKCSVYFSDDIFGKKGEKIVVRNLTL